MNAMPSVVAELAAFGQPATWTPLAGAAVALTVIVTNRPSPLALGTLLNGPNAELRPQVAIPRTAVPLVLAPGDLHGGTVTTAIHARTRAWAVGAVDDVDPDYWRVSVA